MVLVLVLVLLAAGGVIDLFQGVEDDGVGGTAIAETFPSRKPGSRVKFTFGSRQSEVSLPSPPFAETKPLWIPDTPPSLTKEAPSPSQLSAAEVLFS